MRCYLSGALFSSGILLLLVSSCCAQQDRRNLLTNGDFEKDLSGWGQWNSTGKILLDKSISFNGKASCRLQGSQPNRHDPSTFGYSILSQRISVPEGRVLVMRCRYRTRDLKPSHRQVWFHARKLRGPDNEYVYPSNAFMFRLPRASEGKWTKWEVRFFVPDGVRSMSLEFVMNYADGDVWFDDIAVQSAEIASAYKQEQLATPLGSFTSPRRPLFEEVLTKEPGQHVSFCWSTPLQHCPEGSDLAQERLLAAREMAKSGMILYGSIEHLSGVVEQLNQDDDCDLKGTAILTTRALLNAKKLPGGFGPDYSNYFDPRVTQITKKSAESTLKNMSGKPHFYGMTAYDEPFLKTVHGKNTLPTDFSRDTWTPFTKQLDQHIKDTYGAGRFGIPSIETRGDKDNPYRWIAWWRWAADNFDDTLREIAAKTHAYPGTKFVGPDIIFHTIQIPVWDYQKMGNYIDQSVVETYAASMAAYRGGVERYGVGFATQFVTDLSGVPAVAHVQDFQYFGYEPRNKDLWEWTSQVLRSGGNGVSWYPLEVDAAPRKPWKSRLSTRHVNPGRWQTMLEISTSLKALPKLDIPPAEIAILFVSASANSQLLYRGTELHAAYGLFGPENGGRVRFTSDRRVMRGIDNLSDFRVVVLPYGQYVDRAVAEALVKFVRDGGTLLIGDPLALSTTPTSEPLDDLRAELIGLTEKGKPVEAEALKPGKNCPRGYYPLYVDQYLKSTARQFESVPNDAVELMSYANRKPAAWRRSVGKGLVIFFAATPFQPESLVDHSSWKEWFGNLMQENGCQINSPHWQFVLRK